MLVLSFVLSLRLLFLYSEYVEFKEKPFYFTEVEVIHAYEKWSDDQYSTIMKLYSPSLDINFFSKTHLRADTLTDRVRVKLYPSKKMRFSDYLGSSFIASSINKMIESDGGFKRTLLEKIAQQHESQMVIEFYQGIFLAQPLGRQLREVVARLGVSHLIALSGFHLAILSALLFFLFRLLYHPLHKRYFPYRFELYDIGFMVLVILAGYVWFVGAPPSLLRSYVMMSIGWVVLLLGMELISWTFLSLVVMVILILLPKMLLSLAFWFSVMGVLYIFLLLKYFSHWGKYRVTLLISFGIFILILPIVHTIFPVVNLLQLFSPFLSLIFTLFYPLSILLHLVGLGDLFDALLLSLFTLEGVGYNFLLPLPYGLFYLLLSFLSFYSKRVFFLLFSVAFLFFAELFRSFLL